jgi:hypothetical protein
VGVVDSNVRQTSKDEPLIEGRIAH